jgi:hypothetical protein
MTTTFTEHFRFGVPDFLSTPWHQTIQDTLHQVDKALYQVLLAAEVVPWTNSTLYPQGDIVLDPTNGIIYISRVSHISASSPTTFAQDRIANPTFWVEFAGTGAVHGPVVSTDNAIARFNGVDGRFIQDSTVIISDAGCVTITSAGAEIGLTVQTTGKTSGLYSVHNAQGVTNTTTELNKILIAVDQIDGTALGSNVIGLGVSHVVGPSTFAGNAGPRAAGSFTLDRRMPSVGGSGQDVGLAMSFTCNASGLIGAGPSKNTGYGGYASAQLQNGATDWSVLQGFQIGMGVEVGAAAIIQIGNRIGHNPFHAVAATLYESAVDFCDDIASVIGWDALITSTDQGGKHPIKPGGSFIRTKGFSTVPTFGAGIDMSDSVINTAGGGTGMFLAGPSNSFQVTGSGEVRPKRLTDTVVTLADGASVALDASLGGTFKLAAAGNRTILAPTNAPITGKSHRLVIAHEAAGGANRTLSLTTGSAGSFRFGTDITALTVTLNGTVDYIGCLWNQLDDRWDVVSYVKGF